MDQEVAAELSSLTTRVKGLEGLIRKLEERLDGAEQGFAILASMNVELTATLELLTERILGSDLGSDEARAFMNAQKKMRLKIWETIAAANPEAVNGMDPASRSALENFVRGSNASPSS